MDAIIAKARTLVWGTRNAWSLSANTGARGQSKECAITLEIQSDGRHGYHLVMSPDGFFTADHWYEKKEEALRDAEAMFGVRLEDWQPKSRG